MAYKVNCIINGEPVECEVRANETILHVLRNTLALTGAKEGCGAGECGACTIIMNGKPINACLVLAPEMDGAEFETVEGLSHGAVLSPLQESFIEHMGFQCGYCTPGMLMSAEALLRLVLADFDLELLETVPVEYRCYCSRERMAAALVSLGRKQLTELAEDPNGIELTCQFCDSRQRFTPEEIRELLEKASEA